MYTVFTVVMVGMHMHIPRIGKYNTVHSAPFHPSIHNLGNVGNLGAFHAKGAAFATRVIDLAAYGGRNMRRELAEYMANRYKNGTSVLEVGCGVGTLTLELERTCAFNITAVDTSQDMLDVAKTRVDSRLVCANGVDVNGTFDMSIICMTMHEMTPVAHEQMIAAMSVFTAGDVWIVDIEPSYEPSRIMLTGEPYILGYKATICDSIARTSCCMGRSVSSFSLVDGHVRAWVLTRKKCDNTRKQKNKKC